MFQPPAPKPGLPIHITQGNMFDSISSIYQTSGNQRGLTFTNSEIIASYTSFSFSLWIYPFNNKRYVISVDENGVETSRYQKIILVFGELYGNSGGMLALRNDPQDDTLQVRMFSGATQTNINGVTPITQQQWHHVAFTYDSASTTMKLYVNGSEKSSDTNAPYIPSTAYEVWVGSGDEQFGFNGNVRELKYYNRALTSNEVTYLYDKTGGANTTNNYVLYAPLREDSGYNFDYIETVESTKNVKISKQNLDVFNYTRYDANSIENLPYITNYKQTNPLHSYYINKGLTQQLQTVDECLDSNLEDVRYYSRALNENEIVNIYENGKTFGVTQDVDIANLEIRFPFTNDVSGVAGAIPFDSSENIIPKYGYQVDTSGTVLETDKISHYSPGAAQKFFVCYSDSNYGNKATVKKYSKLTNSWSYVGTPGFTATSVTELKFAIDYNDLIYVAYKDTNNSLIVMTTDVSENWLVISNTTNSTFTNISELDVSISKNSNNNNFYVCFSELVSDSYETLVEGTTETVTTEYTAKKLTVIYYDSTSLNTDKWLLQGTRMFSDGIAVQPNITVDYNDDITVGYREGIAIDQVQETIFRPTIQKYNRLTNRWEIIEKRGVTQEQIASNINTTSAPLQTDIIQDFAGNNYFIYSDFENTNKASMITAENRIVNNVNTSILLDSSYNIYMFGYSDEKIKDNYNNIAVKVGQNPSATTDKTITFNLKEQLNFDFESLNDKTTLSTIDSSDNLYLIGQKNDATTLNSDISILKIDQSTGVMVPDISYVISQTTQLNEYATSIVLDNNSVPNIYIGGYSNPDSPDIFNSSIPTIYKLSQDVSNKTFTLATTYLYREFEYNNSRIADIAIDKRDNTIYAAINIDVSNGNISNWEWGLLKVKQNGGVFEADISYIHQFAETTVRGKNNYVKSIKINNETPPVVYMSGYIDEYQYSVIQCKEQSNSFVCTSEVTKLDVTTSLYRDTNIETIDLAKEFATNVEYSGIDSDISYVYLSPYGNYSTVTSSNKITRVLKDTFLGSRVENVIIPSTMQGEFTGITVDKENEYAYLSPYTTDISAGTTYGQNYLTKVVRVSTSDFTNNAGETNFAAVDFTNVIPTLPTYNFPLQVDSFGSFNGIYEYDKHIYLAPWDISSCVRIVKTSFVNGATTTLTANDISSVNIEPLNHYSGVVVDNNHSYYSSLESGNIIQIANNDFSVTGKQVLNLTLLDNAFTNFEGLTQDDTYIYLLTNATQSRLLRISKSNFANINSITDISAININNFSDCGGLYYEEGYIYISPSSNNLVCRLDINNFNSNGINYYTVPVSNNRGIVVNNRTIYLSPNSSSSGIVSKINTKLQPKDKEGG